MHVASVVVAAVAFAMPPKLAARPKPSDGTLQIPYNWRAVREECVMRGITLTDARWGWAELQKDHNVTQVLHNDEMWLYFNWDDWEYYFPPWRE